MHSPLNEAKVDLETSNNEEEIKKGENEQTKRNRVGS